MKEHTHQSDTHDEVLANFNALLADIDFNRELTMLGVGRWRFLLRKKLVEELTALTAGLWRLALERSFPQDFEQLFEAFLSRHAAQLREEKARRFEQTTRGYVDMSQEHKDRDFTSLAEHLVGLFKVDEKLIPSLRLRLILLIRNLYTMIFEHLI